MQTYSHFLFAWGLSFLGKKKKYRHSVQPFLIGSVLPDVALYLFSLVFIVYYNKVYVKVGAIEWFPPLYDELFFNHPLWIISHNFFHAPLVLMVIIFWAWKKQNKTWFWLGWGCVTHSVADILTHHHDGPLLLFPFNGSLRFTSSISYWDPKYFGNIFSPIEHGIDFIILVLLMRTFFKRRIKNAGPGNGETQTL